MYAYEYSQIYRFLSIKWERNIKALLAAAHEYTHTPAHVTQIHRSICICIFLSMYVYPQSIRLALKHKIRLSLSAEKRIEASRHKCHLMKSGKKLKKMELSKSCMQLHLNEHSSTRSLCRHAFICVCACMCPYQLQTFVYINTLVF